MNHINQMLMLQSTLSLKREKTSFVYPYYKIGLDEMM